MHRMRCTSAADLKVPTPPAANSVRNFKSKSGTRIMELLVPLCFRSSYQSVLRCITNFENVALATRRSLEFRYDAIESDHSADAVEPRDPALRV